MHAVCIPVPDEACLGQNRSRAVIKFWATPSVVICHAAEDYSTVVEAQST